MSRFSITENELQEYFDTDAICRMGNVTVQWVETHVACGALTVMEGTSAQHWQFDTFAVARVRRMAHLERTFDAVPELAALVTDLELEIARLRKAG